MPSTPARKPVALERLASSWHVSQGVRQPSPVHVRFGFDDGYWCQLHTPGSGGLGVYEEPPYAAYDMGTYGHVVVEPGGPPCLVQVQGQQLERVAQLWQQPPDRHAGVVLDFPGQAVAIANDADELRFTIWPDQTWPQQGFQARGCIAAPLMGPLGLGESRRRRYPSLREALRGVRKTTQQ